MSFNKCWSSTTENILVKDLDITRTNAVSAGVGTQVSWHAASASKDIIYLTRPHIHFQHVYAHVLRVLDCKPCTIETEQYLEISEINISGTILLT